jgi:pimeloyl-ACP methyl ester carboxylesterase
MGNLVINDYTFQIIEKGEGDPLILVHGSASDYRTWTIPQDELSKNYRTISYSRRYHWPNIQSSEGKDYSMLEHVEDLKSLIKKWNAEPIHLVGHSYGAFICLLLALHEPKLIRTLVLAEPPAITLFVSDPPQPLEMLKLMIIHPRTALALMKFGITGIAPATKAVKKGEMEKALKIFGKATLGAKKFNLLSESRLEQVRQNLIKAEFLGSGYPPLNIDDLYNMEVPTLLVSGKFSPTLFHCILDKLYKVIPNVEWMTVPNSSHIMHEDNLTDYIKSLNSFFNKHVSAA